MNPLRITSQKPELIFDSIRKELPIHIVPHSEDPHKYYVFYGLTSEIFSTINTKNTLCGLWESREAFLKKTFSVISTSYSTDDPLCIFSLGSDCLFMETILGILLIKRGFTKISFFLSDVSYVDKMFKPQTGPLFKKFCDVIKDAYIAKNPNLPFKAKEHIAFYPTGPRSVAARKGLLAGTNIALLKILPPYAKIIYDLQQYRLSVNPNHLLTGTIFVTAEYANSIFFIPDCFNGKNRTYYETTESSTLLSFNKTNTYHDWGCKITSDGTYQLIFNGTFSSKYNQLKMALQQSMTDALRGELPIPRLLNQAEITTILNKLAAVVSQSFPTVVSRFISDYFTDEQQTTAMLASENPKSISSFTLADTENPPLYIKIKQVLSIEQTLQKTINEISLSHYKTPDDPYSGTVRLDGTDIDLFHTSVAGTWDVRKKFLAQGVKTISTSYTKEDPLYICSLGSDALLIETILATTLITYGFKNIFLLPVDPRYTPSKNKVLFTQFRQKIEKTYLEVHEKAFPKENIKFLSKGQNIGKYLGAGGNVVILKSIPPYAKIITSFQNHLKIDKKPEEIIVGNLFVAPKDANAISFIPRTLKERIQQEHEISDMLPLSAFPASPGKKDYSYLDWGCKIYANGAYQLIFDGSFEEFEAMKDLVQTKVRALLQVKLPIPKPLNQEEIAEILQTIQKTISNIEGLELYFVRDYCTDACETMEIIRGKSPRSITTLTLADTEAAPDYTKIEQEGPKEVPIAAAMAAAGP